MSFDCSSSCSLLFYYFYDGLELNLFIIVGYVRSYFVCCLVNRGSTYDILLQISSGVVWQNRDLHLSRNTLYLLSHHLCIFIELKRDLFVYRDDSLTSERVNYHVNRTTNYMLCTTLETEGEVVHVKQG